MPSEEEPARGAALKSRRLLVVAVAALVAVALVVFFLTRGDDSASPRADSSPSTTGPTGSPKSNAPTTTDDPPDATSGPTSAPTPIPTRKAVSLDAPARFGDGVTARITSVSSVKGKGKGVGEISGPALKLTIRLANGTKRAISLDQVTINMAYGKSERPAAPLLGDPATKQFKGKVARGKAQRGTYVFNVPRRGRGRIEVQISHAALSPIVVLAGSAR